MEKNPHRPLSPVVLFFLFFVVFCALGAGIRQGISFWNIYQDFRDGSFYPSSSVLVEVEFVKGFAPSPLGTDSMPLFFPFLDQLEDFRTPIFPGSFSKYLPLDKEGLNNQALFLKRTQDALASLPVMLTTLSTPIKFPPPELYIGEVPDIAKRLLVLTLSRLETLSPLEAVQLQVGIILIGNFLEAAEPNGVLAATRLVSIICRSLAAGSLVCTAHLNPLGRSDAQFIISKLQEAISRLAPYSFLIQNTFRCTSQLGSYMLAHPKSSPDWFRSPGYHLGLIFTDPQFQKEFHQGMIEDALKAVTEPWSVSNPARVKCLKASDDAAKELNMTPWRLFMFGLNPRQAVLNHLFQDIGFQIRQYPNDLASINQVHAAQIAIAIFSFAKEEKRWPSNLPELEQWIGLPLPLDLHSGKPFQFSPGNPPDIRGIGKDQIFSTDDDIPCLVVPKGFQLQ